MRDISTLAFKDLTDSELSLGCGLCLPANPGFVPGNLSGFVAILEEEFYKEFDRQIYKIFLSDVTGVQDKWVDYCVLRLDVQAMSEAEEDLVNAYEERMVDWATKFS